MTYAQVRINSPSTGIINLNDHTTFSIAPGWRPAVATITEGLMGNRPPADPVIESIPLILHVNNDKAAAIQALRNLISMFYDAMAWRGAMTSGTSARFEISPLATGTYRTAAILGPAPGNVEALLELTSRFYAQLEGPTVGPFNLEFIRTGLFVGGGTSILNTSVAHEAVNFTLFADQLPALINVMLQTFTLWGTADNAPGGYVVVTGGSLVGNQKKISVWRPESAFTTKTGTWATVADTTAEGGNFVRYTPTSTDEALAHGLSGFSTNPSASPTTQDLLQNGLLYGTFLVCRNRSTSISYQVWVEYQGLDEATRRYTIDTSSQRPRVIFLGTHAPFYVNQKIRVLPSATGAISESLDVDSIITVLIDEHTNIIRVPQLYAGIGTTGNPLGFVIEHRYPFNRDPRAAIFSAAGTYPITAAGDLSIYYRVPGVTAMLLFTNGVYWRPVNDSGGVTLTTNNWTITPAPADYIPR